MVTRNVIRVTEMCSIQTVVVVADFGKFISEFYDRQSTSQ